MYGHIKEIFKKLSNSHGDEYFAKLTLALNKVVQADYTFIARLNKQANSCRTEVLVAHDKIVDNFEYSLVNTPCAEVVDNNICYYPKGVCSLYPDDQLLIDMKIEGYIGTPLINSKQEIIGIIVALFEKEHTNTDEATTLFQVFSGRIAAELERLDYELSLEDKISARTKELSDTVEQLQITQSQLVESEKMSALGNLVAGVSHEVNTPLGIAITTHSVMVDALKELADKLDNKSLSVKDMTSFRHTTEKALTMQGENLSRAKKLIGNFKKTAADQHQLDIEMLDIGKYYQQVTSTLRSILKPYSVALTIKCEDEIVLATYPGIHAQILTNLINNSVKHGFSINEDLNASTDHENTINIEVKKTATDEVEIIYQDNGKGLSEEAKQHIFEPFFTTARKTGGIGLGMSIIYNLITQKLNGSLELKPVQSGACFQYRFKESNVDINTAL